MKLNEMLISKSAKQKRVNKSVHHWQRVSQHPIAASFVLARFRDHVVMVAESETAAAGIKADAVGGACVSVNSQCSPCADQKAYQCNSKRTIPVGSSSQEQRE